MSIKSSKGFSLIELLVVVSIIGVLAAIGTIAYQGYTSSAQKSATEAAMQQIALAQTEEYSSTGSYYFTDEGDDICVPNSDGISDINTNLFEGNSQLDSSLGYDVCIFGSANNFTIFAKENSGTETEKCQITLARNGTPSRERVDGEGC